MTANNDIDEKDVEKSIEGSFNLFKLQIIN